MILNRAKDYYENDKERFRRGGRGGEQEISTETYLKKKKIKRQNMEKTDTAICQKKKTKTKKISKKIIVRLISLNIITNKLVF